jgi:hypothetical protein
MAQNADVYAVPDPPLEEIRLKTEALALAESLVLKGGTDRTIARDARYNELTALMNRLVAYVQLTSGGVPELVNKAGMEVAKKRQKRKLPLAVDNLKAEPGANAGTIVLTWDPVKHKKNYVLQLWIQADILPSSATEGSEPMPVESGFWKPIAIQGRRRFVATGLVTGRNYRFRAAAQNSAGIGPYGGEAQSVAR